MFLTGLIVFLGLAMFTIPAFWEHIESLQPKYLWMSQIGVTCAEAFLLCLLLWHSFTTSIKIRLVSIILSAIVGLTVLGHSAMLWGLKDGAVRQAKKEEVLQKGLTDMSKEQMAAQSGKFKSMNQREIGKNAQKEFRESVEGRDKAIHAATFAPEWYLNGPMYLILFAITFLSVLLLAAMERMKKPGEIDADFNGVADIDEGKTVNLGRATYAKDPSTGQASAEYGEFKKWKESQGAGGPTSEPPKPAGPAPTPPPMAPSPSPAPPTVTSNNGVGKKGPKA